MDRCRNKQAEFQKKSPFWAGNSRKWIHVQAFHHSCLILVYSTLFIVFSSLKIAIHAETHRTMKISNKPKLEMRITVL